MISTLEPFPIIPLTDDMILQDEPLGSNDKFWCQLPDDRHNNFNNRFAVIECEARSRDQRA